MYFIYKIYGSLKNCQPSVVFYAVFRGLSFSRLDHFVSVNERARQFTETTFSKLGDPFDNNVLVVVFISQKSI